MAKATQKNSKKENVTNLARAYDEVPYSSYPFAQTNPELLQGIAHLFGLNTPDPRKARILEIGCASGNNILSIASAYPHSTCIGFDYAIRQIEEGQRVLKDLGLKNVELKHLSVMDITKDFGEFDYIICHGVLSWVPPEVQEKILEVCSTNLSRDGVAYVSYNTLPGWNAVRSAREMMMYHTENYQAPAEKAAAARQILKFVGDAMRANNNPGAKVMDRELEILNQQADYYLLHEHLEENNYQFYFHQFMGMAQKSQLQYLAETSLEKMFSGNFPAEVAQVLATSTDIVRTEQYMDFIYDRRFRSTLLCHKDRILDRTIKPETIKDGFVQGRFHYPDNFQNLDLNQPATLQFTSFAGMVLSASDAPIFAMLQVLQEAGNSRIAVPELIERTAARLKKVKHPILAGGNEMLADSIYQYILRYLFLGGLYFFNAQATYATILSKKPTAAPQIRYQAARMGWVGNLRQEHLVTTPFDSKLLPLVDGTRDVEALCKDLMPHFQLKELVLNEESKVVEDMGRVEANLPEFVRQALDRYLSLALLVK
ncbi:MAG: methyltransferase domain-containing protein [Proteobacteria bacterium]|nr:methyltransferase domain-containing protein [Pseudomonadota bacterium]